MREKILKLSIALLLFCVISAITFYYVQKKDYFSKTVADKKFKETEKEEGENKIPLRDRMDLAWQHEFEITKDLTTNTVPKERLIESYHYTKELQKSGANFRVMGAIPGINWEERGPKNVSGRTRGIMVDPNDATRRTVWVGSVGGGIWKTMDITAVSPIWTPVNDLFTNIAVSCIVHDPTNTQVMYFGTGEGFFNADAQRGLGIWKSTDGGASWNQLGSTNNANFHYVQRLAIHPVSGDIYAATRSGIQRSQNGGTSWTQVLGNGNGSVTNSMADVEIAADNSIWVGAGLIFSTDGVYRSTTGNTGSWTKLNTGANGFPTTNIQRIEIACAPNNAAITYVLAEGAGSGLGNIYRTTNTGATWATTAALPDDADPGIPNNDFTRGQAWYDFSLAVDPNNSNVVFAGGVDLFKTINGGGSWQQIAHWYGGFGFQYVHADQHIAYFEPGNSNVIYFGNDGGIWRSDNATAAIPVIDFKGDNYNVTQYYACAMNPAAYSNQFLAGAQDNGSQQYNSVGINSTIEVTGGDGMFCHIDQNNPNYQFTSYVANNYFRSVNGGVTWVGGLGTGGGSFVNPTDYDNISFVLYGAISAGNYTRWTNPRTGNTFQTVGITNFGGADVTHVSVSQNTANRVFFGLSNGRVVRVDNANTVASGTAGNWINNGAGMPGGSVSCIAVETGNDNHLLVTYSNYGSNSVWETTNGGTNWTSVEGNIPDMPVRWALFNPLNATQAMIATELGVWSTDLLSGGATNWAPSNTGMANTRTDMLQIRSSDNLVAAATHGRGLYTCDVFTTPNADFVADKKLHYTSKPIQFTDGSYKATSWSWNFGDATSSTAKNPVKTYASPGIYTVTLQINGNPVYTATKVSYIHILPNRGTPYAPAAGGNFDVNTADFGADNFSGTPWQRGNSGVAGKNGVNSGANAWVTGLAGNYVDNSDARLQTPNYNFTASGVYTVRLYRKNSFEIGWDGFRVEYSLDKGDNWTILGNVVAGWYDFANIAATTAFPINEPYFNATVANYTLATWNASALAGNPNVAFRIRFKSDGTVIAPGVAIDDFEIIGPSNSPLPVELVLFTGKDEKDFNLLNWKTASETNNTGFYVERSATGFGFEKVGFVKGAGTTTQISDYRFEDRNIHHNIYYYRLRQVDYNANFKYSNIIAIRRNSDHSGIQFVFPNPFDDEINLVMNGEFDKPILVRLFDLKGKKVFEKNVMVENYQTTILLSSENLSRGTYLLSVLANKETFTQKLFKK